MRKIDQVIDQLSIRIAIDSFVKSSSVLDVFGGKEGLVTSVERSRFISGTSYYILIKVY